jgi:hypothetical protein
VHRGSLDDLDSLKRGAEASDAVIHTAFVHNFSDFSRSVETLGTAPEESGRPFVITSGTMI